MYLLDTNVIAELRKATRADKHVVSWAESVRPSSLFLSVITIMELELGILRIARRDHKQGDMLRRWLEDRVLSAFADHVTANRHSGCPALCGTACARPAE